MTSAARWAVNWRVSERLPPLLMPAVPVLTDSTLDRSPFNYLERAQDSLKFVSLSRRSAWQGWIDHGIAGCSMWQKKCLIVVPVLAFVLTTLLLSCGGSSSTTAASPTATPITLIAIRVCAQAPSNGAGCTPAGTAAIPLSTTDYEFFAQGQFSSNGINTFQNISQSATWFLSNGLLTSEGSGFFTAGTTVGCTCITAASGTVVSAPVLTGIGQPVSACSPCPASPPWARFDTTGTGL